MSKGGRYLKKKGKQPRNGEGMKPKRRSRTVLIVVCTLAVLILAAAIFGVVFYHSMLDNVSRAEVEEKEIDEDALLALIGTYETEPPTEAPETTEPTTVPTTLPYTESGMDIVNVLVVGQSYRSGEESRLADTMILVTVNKETKTITATSFLRDTYVDLPDFRDSNGTLHTCGWNRINTAYALGYLWGGTGGAMEMINQCLQLNFGIDVDYNVEVDFEAFKKVIDILGGVRIELTEAEAEYLNETKADWIDEEVQPGENRLFGEFALAYARMRKAEGDSDSDIKRTERQRKLLDALLKKISDDGFDKLMQIAQEVLPMITTNMTDDEITTCLWEILPLLPEMKFEKGTGPAETTYWSELKSLPDGDAYVLVFDQGQNKQLMKALTEGSEE